MTTARRTIGTIFCVWILAAFPAFGEESEPAIGAQSVPERIVRPFDKTDPIQIQRYFDQLKKQMPIDRDGNPFPMGDGCLPPAPWLPLLMKPKIS